MAAEIVQKYLSSKEEWADELNNGKMFGVMVVTDAAKESSPFFIAAYSGLLGGRNDHEFFVPPVFNSQNKDEHFKTTERRISALSRGGRETRAYSINLQRWLFMQYNMRNAFGESRNVLDIFKDYYSASKAYERKANGVPPSGTGDCCAPKLLQYAFLHNLKPVCMAEFWYGNSPKGEIRHHLQYYPACSGKCKPLLSYMLQGLDIEENPQEAAIKGKLETVYEDKWIVVVNKPSGMPSVPGKIGVKSVVEHLSPTLLPVHRLDMATSGLLILAKNEKTHKEMQSMFAARRVKKEYAAIVEGHISQETTEISLPLSPDILNRPYQKVDYEKGKEAVTIVRRQDATRVLLYPLTGRTHQLRVHCAHCQGLNAPIKGDELYGKTADRLYLHCQRLEFTHPETHKAITLTCPTPF
ncbi:MAG: RluA family pseudouridine synthase [Bacteroidaceae bacterium]|nr:RluA family pseudouridine synthase [Bacteroidaceae bacterium]